MSTYFQVGPHIPDSQIFIRALQMSFSTAGGEMFSFNDFLFLTLLHKSEILFYSILMEFITPNISPCRVIK